jgi:hypothetical protein
VGSPFIFKSLFYILNVAPTGLKNSTSTGATKVEKSLNKVF